MYRYTQGNALTAALRLARLYRRPVPVAIDRTDTCLSGECWHVDTTLPPLEIHCYVNPDGTVEYES